MAITSIHKIIVIITICFSNFFGLAQNNLEDSKIKGTLKLNSIWDNKVYLSLIPSFDKMYTMSNSMIVSIADLDEDGNFEFDTSFLPPENKLYRLHISKKGAPAASLIIGGMEENHLFLIANNNSKISLIKKEFNTPLKESQIIGNQMSNDLIKINLINSYVYSTGVEETYLKREFITKAINEKLRFVADTSSNALISLYALYKSKYENNYDINKQFYEDYLNKWGHNKSTYFKQFRNSLPIGRKTNNYTLILIVILSFLSGIFLSYYYFILRNSSKLKKLTVQERKILGMVQLGKTNKEISEEYNIGLSTVKSHVSNIYSKLNIKSRKEAMNLK